LNPELLAKAALAVKDRGDGLAQSEDRAQNHVQERGRRTPPHNEEALIARCLAQIKTEVSRTECTSEIIVVDNNSTDSTRRIALSTPAVAVVHETVKVHAEFAFFPAGVHLRTGVVNKRSIAP
jgi:hypothetical protein